MRAWFLCLLTTAALAQSGPGLITSVQGNVTIKGGKPAGVLDTLRLGTELQIPAGGWLEVTLFSNGDRLTARGPVRVQATADGLKPLGPGRVTREQPRQNAAGATVKPLSGTLGAGYERPVERPFKALTYAGQRSPSPRLAWTPFPGALLYRVTVIPESGEPVLREDVAAPVAELASRPLAPGLYRLKVAVVDPEWGERAGQDAVTESEFRVLSPAQVAELQALESSSERGTQLLLFARYLQLGLFPEAVKLGDQLLLGGNEPGLRALVDGAKHKLP